MFQQQAHFLLISNDRIEFPNELKFISQGSCIGNINNLPEGWINLPLGQLGKPHAFLFRDEIRFDCENSSNLNYFPAPLAPESLTSIKNDFVTLVWQASNQIILEGRLKGNYFNYPALDFNSFQRDPLKPSTDLNKVFFREKKPLIFVCFWKGGQWVSDQFKNFNWVSLSQLQLPSCHPSSFLCLADWVSQPGYKCHMVEIGYLRSSTESRVKGLKSSPVKTRPLLPSTEHYSNSLPGVAERSLNASMQGESVLDFENKKFYFQQGRLAGFQWGTKPNQGIGKVKSWIEVEGKKIYFVSVSSVAISGEREWGLRESLILESSYFSQPGRLVIDYLFVDDHPELIVSLSVKWPVFKKSARVTSWSPWELTLGKFSFWDKVKLQAYTEEGWKLMKNSVQHVRCMAIHLSQYQNALTFRYFQGNCHRPHDLFLDTSGGKIVINPEGSYFPLMSHELDGYMEHYNWALGWATQPFESWPKEPDEVLLPSSISRLY
jgi:hypothetical protein